MADALYRAVTAHALGARPKQLRGGASRPARRYFAAQGWALEAAQQVERRGVRVENFATSRQL